MANQHVNVRCPAKVIETLDAVGEMFGFTRSELLRTGGMMYCQHLMATDSLKHMVIACNEIARKTHDGNVNKADLEALEAILEAMQEQIELK